MSPNEDFIWLMVSTHKYVRECQLGSSLKMKGKRKPATSDLLFMVKIRWRSIKWDKPWGSEMFHSMSLWMIKQFPTYWAKSCGILTPPVLHVPKKWPSVPPPTPASPAAIYRTSSHSPCPPCRPCPAPRGQHSWRPKVRSDPDWLTHGCSKNTQKKNVQKFIEYPSKPIEIHLISV